MDLMSSLFAVTLISNLAVAQGPVVPTLSPDASASVAAGIVRAVALEKQVQACTTLKTAAETRLDVLRAAMLENNKNLADLDRQQSDARDRRGDAKSATERAAADGDIKVFTAKIRAVEKRDGELTKDEQQVMKTDLPKHQSCIDEAVKSLKALGNSPISKD